MAFRLNAHATGTDLAAAERLCAQNIVVERTTMPRSRIHFLYYLINTIAVTAFALFAFSRNAGNVFVGLDGTYMLTIVQRQFPWMPLSLGFPGNPLKGLGDIWYPINTPLLPGYIIPVAAFGVEGVGGVHFQALACTIFAVEVYLTTVILGRSLGLERCNSIAGGWLVVLAAFPIFGSPLVYPILPMVPHMGSAIGTTSLLIALFAWQGRSGTVSRYDLARALAIGLLAMHLILSQPIYLPLAAATLVASCLGLLAGSATRMEVVVKLLSGVAPATGLLLAGFGSFASGIFNFSAARFWATEFASVSYDSFAISILFQASAFGRAGPGLFVAACAGLAIFALCDRRSRRFAIAIASLIGIIFLYGSACMYLGWWKATLPVYFEFFLLPLYALFAARIGLLVIRKAMARLGGVVQSMPLNRALVLGSGTLAVCAVLLTATSSRPYPFPPVETPMVKALREMSALSPGAEFRGRVAMLVGQEVAASMTWLDIHKFDGARVSSVGNDFNTTGLWAYDVPILFDYSQIMSPVYYRVVTRLLADPADVQMRNVVVLRRADPRALALLGVRYLITDGAQPKPFQLIAEERTSPAELLRLYEVPNANLGKWGVVETRIVSSFADALAAVREPSFDPKITAIVIAADSVAMPGKLRPVERATLRVGPDGSWLIDASSAGSSLLILPVEFSRCLSLTADSQNDAAPVLLRVNALETGVLFTSRVKARIRYFSGPFKNAGCRVRDASDLADALR